MSDDIEKYINDIEAIDSLEDKPDQYPDVEVDLSFLQYVMIHNLAVVNGTMVGLRMRQSPARVAYWRNEKENRLYDIAMITFAIPIHANRIIFDSMGELCWSYKYSDYPLWEEVCTGAGFTVEQFFDMFIVEPVKKHLMNQGYKYFVDRTLLINKAHQVYTLNITMSRKEVKGFEVYK